MEKVKQIRMVCHLEFEGKHYYFGNIKALSDHFGKEQIGISYKSLANHFVTHDTFSNNHCIIRKGELVTSKRSSKSVV